MPPLYFDTCALIKRYYNEVGHIRVKKLANNPGNQVLCCNLGALEIASAFMKKSRNEEISQENARQRLSRFIYDGRSQYTFSPVSDDTWSKGIGLVAKHSDLGLRSLDAIHLASAIHLKKENPSLQMVTADGNLYDAANAEGLKPINPDP